MNTKLNLNEGLVQYADLLAFICYSFLFRQNLNYSVTNSVTLSYDFCIIENDYFVFLEFQCIVSGLALIHLLAVEGAVNPSL